MAAMPLLRRATIVVLTKTYTLDSSLTLDETSTVYVDVTVTSAKTTATLTVLATLATLALALALFNLPLALALALLNLAALVTLALSLALSLALALVSLISSSSSTNLSLAIGIPLAVASLLALVAIGWVFIRKRIRKPSSEFLTFGLNKNLEEEITKTRLPQYEHKWAESDAETQVDVPKKPDMKPSLLNRLSRIMNVPETPVLEFKSPMFLRRFHLLKRDALPAASKVSLPPVPTKLPPKSEVPSRLEPSPGNLYTVAKAYARRLDDELTVCSGEQVEVLRYHNDGWAKVRLVDGLGEGVVPMMCLRPER